MPRTDALSALDRDLREIFGHRLQSLVAYSTADRSPGATAPTLVVVSELGAADLRALADKVQSWHDAGLATPLLLEADEFARSLDAFPFEFGAILADHVLVSGGNPFEGLRVNPDDLRRACEVQARSHLLHLRQGYVETRGRSDALAELIALSSAPLSALMKNVARLHGGTADDGVLAEVAGLGGGPPLSSDRARRLFPEYLSAVEHLTDAIDRWGRA